MPPRCCAGPEVHRPGAWRSRLGADVPFCVRGGRARVTGVGEIVEPLPFEDRRFVLLLPPLSVDTAAVYARWDERRATGAGRSRRRGPDGKRPRSGRRRRGPVADSLARPAGRGDRPPPAPGRQRVDVVRRRVTATNSVWPEGVPRGRRRARAAGGGADGARVPGSLGRLACEEFMQVEHQGPGIADLLDPSESLGRVESEGEVRPPRR